MIAEAEYLTATMFRSLRGQIPRSILLRHSKASVCEIVCCSIFTPMVTTPTDALYQANQSNVLHAQLTPLQLQQRSEGYPGVLLPQQMCLSGVGYASLKDRSLALPSSKKACSALIHLSNRSRMPTLQALHSASDIRKKGLT